MAEGEIWRMRVELMTLNKEAVKPPTTAKNNPKGEWKSARKIDSNPMKTITARAASGMRIFCLFGRGSMKAVDSEHVANPMRAVDGLAILTALNIAIQ